MTFYNQTNQYALFEIEEPTETLLIVEALQEEALKPVIEEALSNQHGGELKDYECKSNGAIEVLWLDDCGVTKFYHATKIQSQHLHQSFAVKHGLRAA